MHIDDTVLTPLPEHGGRLREAARRYGIPLQDWLDLSTGINPHAYPVGTLPVEAWNRLPEDHDGLEEAATAYYGTSELLPVPGSQAVLPILSQLLPGERIAIPHPTYSGHPHAWHDRRVCTYLPDTPESLARTADVVVVVNPNNPTGAIFDPERLLDLYGTLVRRGAWLVVDEAFVDTTPEHSLAARGGAPNLVILRSLGKFFGLGGARVGFVLAPRALREAIRSRLGPWCVAGPSRLVARTALLDRTWQRETCERLARDADRLTRLLAAHDLGTPTGTSLFRWVNTPAAAAIHAGLARHGILARAFERPASLRFGLPRDESGWHRLATALHTLRTKSDE